MALLFLNVISIPTLKRQNHQDIKEIGQGIIKDDQKKEIDCVTIISFFRNESFIHRR